MGVNFSEFMLRGRVFSPQAPLGMLRIFDDDDEPGVCPSPPPAPPSTPPPPIEWKPMLPLEPTQLDAAFIAAICESKPVAPIAVPSARIAGTPRPAAELRPRKKRTRPADDNNECGDTDRAVEQQPARKRMRAEYVMVGSVYVCPWDGCERSFKCGQSVSRHVREVHKKERRHTCSTCDATFAQRSHLENHMRTHTGDRPFPCRRCGEHFAQAATRDNHATRACLVSAPYPASPVATV